MANVVIVAIPAQDDYVWKISSEKVPHMTILSLGEQDLTDPKLGLVESYLQHAVETMLHRFWMSVDRRGPLGPKDADVLYFDKNYCEQQLVEFRDALLKNNVVLDLYNNATQFPEWIPHLTLGFPETPANPDERDYPGIHGVQFDKIALWINDFAGPEWRLKGYSPELAMSEMKKSLDLNKSIEHANRALNNDDSGSTVKSIIDGLPSDQRDLFDLVVGASVSGVVLPTDQGYEETYSKMSTEAALCLDFVVGAVNSDAFEVKHSTEDLDGYLRLDEQLSDEDAEHHGVKGMKWGVRKDGSGSGGGGGNAEKEARSAARTKVKAGTATLDDAHVAAVKSTGHRVTNAFLGDKTYWKRAALIAGGTLVAAGASLAVPAVLPAHILTGIAAHAGYTVIGGKAVVSTAAAGKGTAATVAGTKLVSASALGQQIATGVGLAVTNVGGGIASGANSVSNLARSIRGNTRVRESHAKLGDQAARNMSEGSKRTRKVLNQSGSLPKRKLRHEDLLDHFDLSQKYDPENDARQHGIRGMKWGIRRVRGAGGLITNRIDREASDDSKLAAATRQKIKKGGGVHVVSNEELQKLVNRINLENNYAKATAEKSVLEKTHSKIKKGLDLGKTANDALNFATSPTGVLLVQKIAGKHTNSSGNQLLDKLAGAKATSDLLSGKGKKGKKGS